MDDAQLLRYGRQILLPSIGIEGQQRLLNSHALIIGLGGLGSPAAMYLASSGVGHLTLADFDRVELSNLQRQIVHATSDLGRLKAESARDRLSALNPDIEITVIGERLNDENIYALATKADVVLDCSDNFATRFAINRACVATRTPLVSGAAIRLEGQLALFRLDRDDSPCYHCVYPEQGELHLSCSETGVLAPLTGVIGCLQAVEALKVLTQTTLHPTSAIAPGIALSPARAFTPPSMESYELTLYDAQHNEWRKLKLRKDPACPVCARRS